MSKPKPVPPKFKSKDPEMAALIAAQVRGGKHFSVKPTGSMKPAIDESHFLVVQPVPFEQVQKDDILVYNGRLSRTDKERRLLVHRAVMKDKYGWIMCGDANRWSETWDRLTPETMVGRVVAIYEPEVAAPTVAATQSAAPVAPVAAPTKPPGAVGGKQ